MRQHLIDRVNKHEKGNVEHSGHSVIYGGRGRLTYYDAYPKLAREVGKYTECSRDQNVEAEEIPK